MRHGEALVYADLTTEQMAIVAAAEEQLPADVRLVAVKRTSEMFVLEAKLAPNEWLRVDQVYPEIEDLKSFYSDGEACKAAKAALKGFLISNKLKPQLKKRPIRIRVIRASDED
ncbi:MAG: hypothetical protein QNJ22_12795 [Desulfosarcinaceae bacterium]|nr:hypothetical protein [Desulfosarcinaceae bacterium]